MTVVASPNQAPLGPDIRRTFDEELIIKEARQRRRRRWIALGLGVALLAATGFAVAAIDMGGQGTTAQPTTSGTGSSPSAPPVNGNHGGPSPVSLSGGPTPIFFLNSQQGWITVGCGAYCYQYRPAIMRTSNGGRTWRVMNGPDVGSVPFSAPTWMALGGQSDIRFVNLRRGFYLQVGELWTTDSGGSRWKLERLGGPVISFTTVGNSAWALVNDCPRFPLSCSRIDLYRWSTSSPVWVHSSHSFSVGRNQPTDSQLVAAGSGLVLVVAGHQFHVGLNGRIDPVSTACQVIGGSPVPRHLVGICDLGGGGNASSVTFALSKDQGKTWRPMVGGPPSNTRYNWVGEAAINGQGTLLFVVGGATLWRTSSDGGPWRAVYATPVGSDEELYPVVFASTTVGFMGESGNEAVSLLKTTDGGVTWKPVASVPTGSQLELPSGR